MKEETGFFKKRSIGMFSDDGTVGACQCPSSRNVHKEGEKSYRYTHTKVSPFDKTKPVDIVVLTEFKEPLDREQSLLKLLYSSFQKGATKYNYIVIPAMGCTPEGFLQDKDVVALYSNCMKKNINTIIKRYSPKAIITLGRSIYGITGDKDVSPDKFFIPIGARYRAKYPFYLDDSWFWAKEYGCRVYPCPPVYQWMHADGKEKDVYEFEFTLQQFILTEKYISGPLDLQDDISYVVEEDPNAYLKSVISDESIKAVAIDTESEGLNPFEDLLFSVQIATDDRVGHYLGWGGVDPQIFKQLFTCGKTIIMHNGIYDTKVFKINGIDTAECTFDTLLAAHQCNENMSKGLKALAWVHTKHGGYEREMEEHSKEYKSRTFTGVELAVLQKYGCYDAVVTFKLFKYFSARLQQEDEDVRKNYYDYVIPAVNMVADLEAEGVATDLKYLIEYNDSLVKSAAALQAQIYKEAGAEFNIKSGQQLSEILVKRFDVDLKKEELTKDGNLKLSKAHMAKFEKKGITFASLITKFSHTMKEISQFGIESFKETGVKEGFLKSLVKNKIYGSYKLHGTVSGRASGGSDDTTKSVASMNSLFGINFQNIPTTREFRRLFLPPKGFVWGAADYNSAEVTTMSQVAGRGPLEDMVLAGKDMHCETGVAVAASNGVEVTYDQFYAKARVEEDPKFVKFRKIAKAVSFALQFGGTKVSIAKNLNISEEEAEKYVQAYFKTYPEVKAYIDRTRKEASANCFVKTLLGRKRNLPQLSYVAKESWKNPTSYFKVSNLFNNAVNVSAQGTVGQVTLIAMTKIWKELKEKKLRSRLIINIHDEICMFVAVEEIPVVKELVERHMMAKYYENIGGNTLSLEAEMKFGEVWKEEKSLDYWESHKEEWQEVLANIERRNQENVQDLIPLLKSGKKEKAALWG